MKYQKLGSSDIEVSKIAFGAWGLGGGSVWADMSPDVRSASHLLDIAEETGINYIDTAPVYGTGASEEILGKALQGRRDRFILQTKCSLNWRQGDGNFHYERDGYTVNNCTSAAAVRKDVEESLLRMNTDYIDVIVVHAEAVQVFHRVAHADQVHHGLRGGGVVAAAHGLAQRGRAGVAGAGVVLGPGVLLAVVLPARDRQRHVEDDARRRGAALERRRVDRDGLDGGADGHLHVRGAVERLARGGR